VSEASHASIAVPVPVRRLFTYSVPSEFAGSIAPGVRVRVPFGPRRVEGTVVEWPAEAPTPDVDVKAIDAVLEDAPSPCGEILELTRFVADYYLSSWGEAIEAALPPDPGGRRVTVVARTPQAAEGKLSARATARRRLLELLPADGTAVPLTDLGASERRAVPALHRLGWVDLSKRVLHPGVTQSTPSAPAAPPLEPTAAQLAVLDEIRR
jgi:primosomal protein N' (replication factor Y)